MNKKEEKGPPEEREVLLEAVGLWKIYRQGGTTLPVLKAVDLKILSGELIVVRGPSGAGKTTLLHLLGGLDFPSQGEVLLRGRNWQDLPDGRRSRVRGKAVAFVFQFYHLLEALTALENVMLPARIQPQLHGRRSWEWGRHVRERASSLLEQVGLSARLHHRPSQLSGGERQRVGIARALMNSPEVLLCDEPTGNLDSENGMQIKRILWELNRQERRTIVLVTHDPDLARDADRVIELKDGVVVLRDSE
jgi:lipoprotein-releasing system ATP-binding protein